MSWTELVGPRIFCILLTLNVIYVPVRPDNDEDVESDDEAQEAEDNVASAEVDERADDLDHVVDQADDRQHNPRHHQTGFSLKTKPIKKRLTRFDWLWTGTPLHPVLNLANN